MNYVGGKNLKRCPFCNSEMDESVKEDGVWAVHPTEIKFQCYLKQYMFRVTEESRELWNKRYGSDVTEDLIDISVLAENIINRVSKIRRND